MLKNIKKIALSLLVVGLALGVQSFKYAEEKKPNVGEIVYLLNTTGDTYFRFSDDGSFPTEGDCTFEAEYPECSQSFNLEDDPGVLITDFPAGMIPPNNIPGTEEAYWAF